MKKKRIPALRCRLVYVAVASCFAVTPVFANPSGVTVVSGNAGFTTQGSTLTVTNTAGAILNWRQFSIGAGEITRFVQPSAASSVLNRVIGQDPSQILGTLLSNGRVFLVNPNGIVFGAGAVIDVGGLVASTLQLSDRDFLAGRLDFTAGAVAGGIANDGSISTPAGGRVYLIAPDIRNSGLITSPQGDILLAAGHSVNLTDSGNPDVQVTVAAGETGALNVGALVAQSGRIGIYGALISQQGVADADTAIAGENGRIMLKASRDITLQAGSLTTASGTRGGIHDGGEVRIIADGKLALRPDSAVHVDGGEDGGHGGFLELSGKRALALDGTYTGRARAPGYRNGTLLLDPTDVTIGTTCAGGIGGSSICPADLNGFADVTVAADHDINVEAAIANGDVNDGSPGGSLTLTAGHDVNVRADVGSNAGRFNHDLTMNGSNQILVKGNLWLGENTLTLAGGDVIVSAQDKPGWTTVDTLGDIRITGRDLKILAGDTAGSGWVHPASATMRAGGDFTAELSRDVLIKGGTDLWGARADAGITAGGDVTITAASLALAGGTIGDSDGQANARIDASNDVVLTLGSLSLDGGIANLDDSDDSASASATIRAARDVILDATGAVALNAGTANVDSESETVHVDAEIRAGRDVRISAASLALHGGTQFFGTSWRGSDGSGFAEAVVSADNDVVITLSGPLTLAGGAIGFDSSSNFVRSDARITAGHDIRITSASIALTGGEVGLTGNSESNTAHADARIQAGHDVTLTTGDLTLAGGHVEGTDSYNSYSADAAIVAANEVRVTTTGTVQLSEGIAISSGDVVSATARIETAAVTTLFLDFRARSSGGYFVNGIENAIRIGETGFFVDGAPAVLDSNMFVTYSVVPGIPVEAALDFGSGQINDSTDQDHPDGRTPGHDTGKNLECRG